VVQDASAQGVQVDLEIFADNASAFYTANGFVTLLALLPLYVWTLAVSIAILRKAS